MIKAEHVTKIYPKKAGGKAARRDAKKGFMTALSDISFTVAKGEAVGIIGKNGSGKSTLLKLIAGVSVPSRGTLAVDGRAAALLELGAGFHPEYTGIRNIYLNGTVNGRTKAEIAARLPEILRFADIGDYASEPVKTYSDGMFLRLAFAAAALDEPDILIVDEALAVGDFLFQAKCFRLFETLRAKGTTILFVSHDIDAIRRFCSRVLWLDHGRLRMDGAVDTVTAAYMAEAIGQGCGDGALRRFGSAVEAIKEVTAPSFWAYGQKITLCVRFVLPDAAVPEAAALSVSVKNREGLDLLVFTTRGRQALCRGTNTVRFQFYSPFCSGSYYLAVGLEQDGGPPITYYDYIDGAMQIRAGAEGKFGVFHIPSEVETVGEGEG